MIARLSAILAMAILAGCAGTGDARPDPVSVYVKVKEPCIDQAPKRPAYQTGTGDYPGEKQAAAILASDFEKAEQYGANWEAAAAGCLMVK